MNIASANIIAILFWIFGNKDLEKYTYTDVVLVRLVTTGLGIKKWCLAWCLDSELLSGEPWGDEDACASDMVTDDFQMLFFLLGNFDEQKFN